ncbi:SRPBCC family protein [Sorangium sp. So ce887]|uniref:SRPBCC family protein n=1 Tax=Sorangium sp. So ce887 TaxID=3133324 RepID=UPI003F648495
MTQPSTFRVERSATVAAPAEAVYAQVVDFHAWQGWSPWEKLDPSMQRTYGGPASGTGASYAGSGNEQAGEGKMTITEAKQPSNVTLRLEFIKPFEATNTTTFGPRCPARPGHRLARSPEPHASGAGAAPSRAPDAYLDRVSSGAQVTWGKRMARPERELNYLLRCAGQPIDSTEKSTPA